MATIKDLLQTADWKQEKHVPVIDVPSSVQKGSTFSVSVRVGKEIVHPNTTEHHIAWIEVYFLPKNEKFPYQIGRFELSAHGASVQGPNTSGIVTEPAVTASFKTEKSGTVLAASFCNIHGLWQSSQELTVE